MPAKFSMVTVILIIILGAVSLAFPKLEIDGEFRNRFGYFINKDLDSERPNDFGAIDLRAKLGLKYSLDKSPFYAYYKFRVGNIVWGHPSFGGAQGTDKVNVQTENLYIGWNSSNNFFNGMVGLIALSTPLEVELDDDVAGVFLRFNYSEFRVDFAYSTLFNTADESATDFDLSDFEFDTSSMAHLLYARARHRFINNEESGLREQVNVWYMYMTDTRFIDITDEIEIIGVETNVINRYDNYDYSLHWIGIMNRFDIWKIRTDIGFSYNLGTVTETNGNTIPVNAYYLYGRLRFDPIDQLRIFGRLNLSSGNNGNTDELNRFQVIGRRGSLDTGLSILFGGGPFHQQAYFSKWNAGVETRRNLTGGRIRYTEPGIFIVEGGAQLRLRDKINFDSEIVVGYASTANPINGQTLLGLEFDLHNRIRIARGTDFYLTFAYLLPGRALQEIYEETHGYRLGGDHAIKIEGMIEFKF